MTKKSHPIFWARKRTRLRTILDQPLQAMWLRSKTKLVCDKLLLLLLMMMVMMMMMMFTEWVSPVPDNPLRVKCRYCEVELNTDTSDVKRHSVTSRHQRNAALHLLSAVGQHVTDTELPVNGQERTADG